MSFARTARTSAAVVIASATFIGIALGGRAGAVDTAFGPPILCEPFDVETGNMPLDGSGKLIKGKADEMPGYVLKGLKAEENVVRRMELLRRAAMNVHSRESRGEKQAIAWRVLGPLALLALDSAGEADATRLLDLGFFCAALDQGDVDLDWNPGRLNGINGYAYLDRACKAAQASRPADKGDDAATRAASAELAAAMCVHPALRNARTDGYNHEKAQKAYDMHVTRALKLAPKGSDVEAGVQAHLKHWGYSAAEIVKRSAKAD